MYSSNIVYLFSSLVKNRSLVAQLLYRDIFTKYKGLLLGVAWAAILPLVMLSLYTFVFGTLFKARWSNGEASSSTTEYALMLFLGLIVHGLFAEVLARAPGAILSQPNFVKKVVFPLELLPIAILGSGVFNLIVGAAIWIVVAVYFDVEPSLTWLYLPIILIPAILMATGLSWMLAAFGVFFKDISQFSGIATTLLLFMAPILYPISLIPEKFQSFLYLNPLTSIVTELRGVMFYGQNPSIEYLIVAFISCILFWGGFFFFQRLRGAFADVI